MTILVLGGGASGMMAALAASADPRCHVILVERQARVGRKLLATGNGRCNLTNLHADPTHYHGAPSAFVAAVLDAFGVQKAMEYFHSLGLVTVTEASGRVYPFSDQANSVVDVLRFALERPNLEVHTGCEVTKLWKRRDGYLLKTTGGDFAGQRLIVAAGGIAGEKLGATATGYEVLESLGHKRTALSPALVQLTTDGTLTRALKGVRAEGHIQLYRGAQLLAESSGEIQFIENGVSGPAIFDISRTAASNPPGLRIRLDLMPQMTEDTLLELLRRSCSRLSGRTAEDLLTGAVHNRLGKVLVKAAGIPLDTPLSQLDDQSLRQIAHTVKGLELTYTGTLGMDHAQVTAGGIDTAQFDPNTLESRLAPGVFACGEVLDVDGDCGGYNLQWAWSSGYVAGVSAARETEAS